MREGDETLVRKAAALSDAAAAPRWAFVASGASAADHLLIVAIVWLSRIRDRHR
jgi:hypothetical protein